MAAGPGTAPAAEPAALRLPHRLRELRHARVDLVGVASVEAGEMARYLLAAGFAHLVGHDLQPDLESLRRSHRLAHAGLRPEERREHLDGLLQGLQRLHLGTEYLQGIERSQLIIATQGWFLSPANSGLQHLRAQGHPFYSLIQAYLDLALGQVVGITGSHGKSTTSALAAALLRQSGRYQSVWLAGNDRHDRQALLEVASDSGQGCLVLEISNRQLLQLDRAPELACLTNITPNHLEEHGGLRGYIRAKRRIFQLPGCRTVVRNGDDRLSFAGGRLPPGLREVRFAREELWLAGRDGAFEAEGWLQLRRGGESRPVLPTSQIPLMGEHNLANARAALAILASLGPGPQDERERAARALHNFHGLVHRTQLVRRHQGVDYVDDLSSTTPQSTVAAVLALGRACTLIAGGEDKGIDFQHLAKLVGGPVRTLVLLPGAGSDRLEQAVREEGGGELIHRCKDLHGAVDLAASLARSGEAVLLSPACPGFFSAHYRQGGFRQAVRSATSPRPRTGPG